MSTHVNTKENSLILDEKSIIEVEHHFGGWLKAKGYELHYPDRAKNVFVAQLGNFEILLSPPKSSFKCPFERLLKEEIHKNEVDYFSLHFDMGYTKQKKYERENTTFLPVKLSIVKEFKNRRCSSRIRFSI